MSGRVGLRTSVADVRPSDASVLEVSVGLGHLPGTEQHRDRGEGYFYGIELVKDKATKETFNDAESEKLLRGFLSKALYEAGLYCRADDRGDPVIQLSPPLICGQEHFDEMEQKLRGVLEEAWTKL